VRRHDGQYLDHIHLGVYFSSSYLCHQQGQAGLSTEQFTIVQVQDSTTAHEKPEAGRFAMPSPPPPADHGTGRGHGSPQFHLQQTVLRKIMPVLLLHSSHLLSQDNVTNPSCKALSGFSVADCVVLHRPKNSHRSLQSDRGRNAAST